jgi:protein SCO1/2
VNTPNTSEFDFASRQRGIRNTVLILLLVITCVVGLIVHKVTQPRILNEAELRTRDAIVFDQPRRFSDFSLLDANGQAFTRTQLEGKWSLVFFGFTQCPDICPTTLMDLQHLLAALPAEIAANTQVILVSLDPARDTPEVLKSYVEIFNKDFLGVTGEFLTIRRFANEANVAFAKVVQGNDYTVDHSGNIVLINPRGDYHGFFKPPFTLEKIKLTYSSIYHSFDF